MAKNSSDPAVPTTTGSISPWCQCHSAVSLKTMESALFFSNKKNHQETSFKLGASSSYTVNDIDIEKKLKKVFEYLLL